MPILEIVWASSWGLVLLLENLLKQRLKKYSEVKETYRTDAIDVKNVYKGHNNVSTFNFIQIRFMWLLLAVTITKRFLIVHSINTIAIVLYKFVF